MERVSQVLQFPVIIERRWPFSFDPEAPQELHFICSGVARQRWVLKKFPKPRFFLGSVKLSLNVLEFLGISRCKSPAQRNLHSESCEVDIPGLNERIQKRHAVLVRHVEDIRVQKLKNVDPRLLVGPATESGHQME